MAEEKDQMYMQNVSNNIARTTKTRIYRYALHSIPGQLFLLLAVHAERLYCRTLPHSAAMKHFNVQHGLCQLSSLVNPYRTNVENRVSS